MRIDPRAVQRKRWLRGWAIKHGIEIPQGFRVATPTVGESARELIARVQRRAFQGEHTTRLFDQRTLDLIRPKATLGDRAVQVALREVGVTEQPAGSNSGPRVSEYQRVTGAFRAPWCASFVTWVFAQLGVWLQGFNTAYCPSWVAAARANRNGLSVVSWEDAEPGDCPVYGPNADGVAYHIGILVTRVAQDGSFKAVEGNTSNTDGGPAGISANGGGVFVRNRHKSQVQCFVRVHASRR